MISVIVRTLGRASLVAALESVAAQQRSDVEVIVVDASGALVPPVCDGLNIRVVSQGKPLHRSVAASAGLAAVRTRWAIFLDDDDVLLTGHLSKLATAIENAPDAVLAHTGVELVRLGEIGPPAAVFDAAFEPWELLLGNRMPIHAALFDAQRAQAAGADFDPTLDLYEDWDFWLQLRLLGPFVHVPGVSARYIVSAESSGVHLVAFGDETYWRVWLKWWARAPRSWWAGALKAGASLTRVRQELIGKLDQQHAELLAEQGHAQKALSENEALRQEIVAGLRVLEDARQTLAGAQALAASTAAELDAERQALRAAQQVLSATQSDLAVNLAAHQTTLQALGQSDQALAEQRIAQQRSAENLQAIQNSACWRWTAPLRAVMDAAMRSRLKLARLRRDGTWRRFTALPQASRAYQAWIDSIESRDRASRAADLVALPALTIAVLMPVYNPQLAALDAAIQSVLAQSHPHWQLCIADDASTQPGVREALRAWAAREPRIRLVERTENGHISAASNSALALATSEWVALLDQDDVLAPNALAEVADAIGRFPDAGIVYSDEDKLDSKGHRFEPYFKPAFNIELLRGQNLISHLGVYRRSLVLAVGSFREGYEGSQDHDLALRCVERLRPAQVIHIPRVLYHWRAARGSTATGGEQKPYAMQAGLRAVADHLKRSEPGAVVEVLQGFSYFRVRYPLPRVLPQVLAIVAVPAIDDAARAWVQNLQSATDYPALEMRLVQAATAEDALRQIATTAVQAPLVLSLRYGLLPAGSNWLAELLSHALRPGVGIVGGRIDSPSGHLLEGPLIGGGFTAWQGSSRRRGGYFGRAVLVQALSAVSFSALLTRGELLPLLAGGSTPCRWATDARRAGWRALWTPFAALVDVHADGSSTPADQGAQTVVDDAAFHPNLEPRQGRFVVAEEARKVAPRAGF